MIPVAPDAEQALAMIRSHPDGTVVDVRDEEEYITGHLQTPCCCRSTRSAPRRLQRPCPIRVARSSSTGKTGSAAGAAAEKLAALGYSELYDLGGLGGWPYGLE